MNIELAKKLKDAGFPQNHKYFMGECEKCGDIFELEQGTPCIPTLSELIETCGKGFKFLERLRKPDEEGSFWAESDNIGICGETPEEAVANLWLELNKK